MLTPLVRIQLAVFAVLAAIALVFTAFQYADASKALGIDHYEVSAQFGDTSGLYPRALVTYRGVDVGKVSGIDLAEDGALVHMDIDDDVKIPKSVIAEIHSTSAIGEQYVDLVPRTAAGPFLGAGAVVPKTQTAEMPQISPVLESLNELLKSVPPDKTAAVLDEVDAALGGSSQDLSSLIDDTTRVVDQAQREVNATTSLIANLSPLLDTQRQIGDQTASYVSSLASFTGQLRASDPDIRTLLDHGPPATDAVDSLVDEIAPTLPGLLKNTTTTAAVLNIYNLNIRQLLIAYPALQARLQAALLPHRSDGAAKLDLKTNVNNPPPCIEGYIPVTERRDPSDTSLTETPAIQHCELAARSPEGVRGARNALCPNDPARREATPTECGLAFSGSDSRVSSANKDTVSPAAEPESSGVGAPAPTGLMDFLGGDPEPKGDSSWKSLLMNPLDL